MERATAEDLCRDGSIVRGDHHFYNPLFAVGVRDDGGLVDERDERRGICNRDIAMVEADLPVANGVSSGTVGGR